MAVNAQDPFNLAGVTDFATRNVLLQGAANRIDQTIPGASIAFSGPGRSTSKITLDPGSQALFDRRVAAANTGAIAGAGILADLQGGRQAVQQATFDRAFDLIDPAFQTIDKRRRNQLLNRGIMEGDAGFNEAIRLDVTDPRNAALQTATQNAIIRGGDELTKLSEVGRGLMNIDPRVGIPSTQSFFAPSAIDTLGPEQLETQRNMAANNAKLMADQIDAQVKSGNLQALTSLGSAAIVGLLAHPTAGKTLAATIMTTASKAGKSVMSFMAETFGIDTLEPSSQAAFNAAKDYGLDVGEIRSPYASYDPFGVGGIREPGAIAGAENLGLRDLSPELAAELRAAEGMQTAFDFELEGEVISPTLPPGFADAVEATRTGSITGIPKALDVAGTGVGPFIPRMDTISFVGTTEAQAIAMGASADSVSILGPELAAELHAAEGMQTAFDFELSEGFGDAAAGVMGSAMIIGALVGGATGGTRGALKGAASSGVTAGVGAGIASAFDLTGGVAALGPGAFIAVAGMLAKGAHDARANNRDAQAFEQREFAWPITQVTSMPVFRELDGVDFFVAQENAGTHSKDGSAESSSGTTFLRKYPLVNIEGMNDMDDVKGNAARQAGRLATLTQGIPGVGDAWDDLYYGKITQAQFTAKASEAIKKFKTDNAPRIKDINSVNKLITKENDLRKARSGYAEDVSSRELDTAVGARQALAREIELNQTMRLNAAGKLRSDALAEAFRLDEHRATLSVQDKMRNLTRANVENNEAQAEANDALSSAIEQQRSIQGVHPSQYPGGAEAKRLAEHRATLAVQEARSRLQGLGGIEASQRAIDMARASQSDVSGQMSAARSESHRLSKTPTRTITAHEMLRDAGINMLDPNVSTTNIVEQLNEAIRRAEGGGDPTLPKRLVQQMIEQLDPAFQTV
jgi:hypothetical protein